LRFEHAAACALAISACTLLDPLDGYGPQADGGDATSDTIVPKSDASPCGAQHQFCDDFDNGPFAAKWDFVNTSDGPDASMGLSDAQFVSPPFAMQVNGIPNNTGVIYVEKDMPAFTSRAHIEFDVKLQTSTDPEELDFSAASMAPTAGWQSPNLYVARAKPTTAEIEESANAVDGGYKGKTQPLSATFSNWTHITYDIDPQAQQWSLSLDGTVAATMDLNAVVPIAAGPWKLKIGVAFQYYMYQPVTIWFDNVVIDTQ
jgi:hypothetical protein